MGERRGRVKSRNMYKGPMGMDSEVKIDHGSRGVSRAGENNREKTGTIASGQDGR